MYLRCFLLKSLSMNGMPLNNTTIDSKIKPNLARFIDRHQTINLKIFNNLV